MDLRRSDLGLLLALDALLAEGGVTRAAERLGISQPALSAQLARLRDVFGDPLLVPAGKRMAPTPLAEDLREPLHSLLDELQALVRERRAFEPAKDRRTLRVSATDYLHRVVTQPFADYLADAAPGVRLALLAFDARRAWTQLENDEIDLIVTSEGLTPEGARGRRLFDERFVYIQRPGHPRGTGPLDLDGFCHFDHILVSPVGGAFVGITDEALASVGRTRRVALSVPNFLLVVPLIAGSDRVAVVPERLARSYGRAVDVFEPPLPIPGFAVFSSWHSRRHRDLAHVWLRERLAEAAASTG